MARRQHEQVSLVEFSPHCFAARKLPGEADRVANLKLLDEVFELTSLATVADDRQRRLEAGRAVGRECSEQHVLSLVEVLERPDGDQPQRSVGLRRGRFGNECLIREFDAGVGG